MNTATPTDTYDHTLGSGALSWPWWRKSETTGVSAGGEIADDWTATLVADDGNDGETSRTFGHAVIIGTARRVLAGGGGRYVSDELRRQCEALIFSADDADFDASTGDELLQIVVLGEVIFG